MAELLAATIGHLCEGQVRELQLIYDVDRDESGYLEAIGGKTAALFATSCRIGALVAGCDRTSIEQLTQYGYDYGMAFQIVDDILDLVATDEELGKPSGNDLHEGVYTLPVNRMIKANDPVKELLGAPLSTEERDFARSLVVNGKEITTSIETAREYAESALEAISGFPNTIGTLGLRSAAANLLSALDR